MKRKSIATLSCIVVVALLVVAFLADNAFAKYPLETVTLITHSSPGGGSDLFLRTLIKYLGPQMGVNFVVENVRGGSGAMAMAKLATSPADGSIFYASTPTFLQTPMLAEVEYTVHDLEPMVNVFLDPMVVYTRAESPFQTLADAVEAARANPGAKWGGGTPAELAMQILVRLQEEAKLTDVRVASFEGGGDLMLAVLGGTVDLGIGEPAEILSQLEAGQIRLLAVFTDERIKRFPDVPTAKELGLPIVLTKFRGLTGPKGLPPEIVKAWEEAIPKILADPAYQAVYEAESLIPAFMDQKTFQAYIDKVEAELREYLVQMGLITK